MSEWIELNQQALNLDERRNVGGVEIADGLSPYDLPERVRRRYDRDQQQCVIDFEYLDDDEPRESQTEKERITLLIGKHSGRLYAIQFDCRGLAANQLVMEIEPSLQNALERLAAQRRFHDKKSHYEVARKVVDQEADQLFAGIN